MYLYIYIYQPIYTSAPTPVRRPPSPAWYSCIRFDFPANLPLTLSHSRSRIDSQPLNPSTAQNPTKQLILLPGPDCLGEGMRAARHREGDIYVCLHPLAF